MYVLFKKTDELGKVSKTDMRKDMCFTMNEN